MFRRLTAIAMTNHTTAAPMKVTAVPMEPLSVANPLTRMSAAAMKEIAATIMNAAPDRNKPGIQSPTVRTVFSVRVKNKPFTRGSAILADLREGESIYLGGDVRLLASSRTLPMCGTLPRLEPASEPPDIDLFKPVRRKPTSDTRFMRDPMDVSKPTNPISVSRAATSAAETRAGGSQPSDDSQT